VRGEGTGVGTRGGIRIEPWSRADLPLLQQLLGDPAMMGHLGGPESPEQLAARQARYEQPDSLQFKIVDEPTGEGIGWVGYWERDEPVYEIGWSVLPAFQGRGVAASAAREAIAIARATGRHRFLHAYPSVDNAASNALCRKLGFALLGSTDFEYPKGALMRCNDWRLDLSVGS
jgi:RimJ/RimL family protein N-acetyltransferase